MQRRVFLQAAIIGGGAPVFGIVGCATTEPQLARVDEFTSLGWLDGAFEASTIEDALKKLHGAAAPISSNEIKLDVPVFAESAAMVPVTVTTALPNVQAVYLTVQNNPQPMAVSFDILPGALPYLSTRLWVTKNSEIAAYVMSNGKLYFASVDVLLQGVDGCITHKLGT